MFGTDWGPQDGARSLSFFVLMLAIGTDLGPFGLRSVNLGSMLKIDASYLSPNVNIAARLESGTQQNLCRRIDRVTVKGSSQPMALYTYDVPRCQVRGRERERVRVLSLALGEQQSR
eukprot:526971-Rhodomonas_salina.3